VISREQLKKYRLNQAEVDLMTQLLGREPAGVEWALFSALWSEHCSYKSSKVHLKKLFSRNSRVVEGFGENAGVIDLGQGERLAFKIESHNHPSFIEPYQGAATGVGGILRDIFTMGARPIALANYLCFGEPDAERMPALIDGVVRGIAGYGNCVGVPTVTGQTEFHKSYNKNILVNAMAVGLFSRGEKVFLSRAHGVGNWVVYVGAKTGRDGVHGASMASESFAQGSESQRPTVQIGDPFYEKLLIESCLEVMRRNLVVAIQDMGAAGLTSSSFEMASKGGVGLRIDLDHVPLRDSTMTPEDILLSESQERMLLICEPNKFSELQEVFHRWGLDACKIGVVCEEEEVELRWHDEVICRIDPDILVERAPRYERPYQVWSAKNRVNETQLPTTGALLRGDSKRVTGVQDMLLGFLKSVKGTSRRWIFQQYDGHVGANTVRDSRDSVAIVRLPESERALGIVLGCRPHVMRWDAREGGIDAVAYPALELAARGFETHAVTDCLNFGNPERPEIMSEFVAAIEGMNSVCRSLDAPIISGNVSFYNEHATAAGYQNITSTPSTGLVGLRSSIESIPQSFFVAEGESVYLLRLPLVRFGGAAQEEILGHSQGVGFLDAALLAPFIRLLRDLILDSNVISASRVVGKFGLAYALARMCGANDGGGRGIGFRLEAQAAEALKIEDRYFSETLYEVILTCPSGSDERLERVFRSRRGALTGVELMKIGTTGGSEFVLKDIQLKTSELQMAYEAGVKSGLKQGSM